MRTAFLSLGCMALFAAGSMALAASLNAADRSFMTTAARINMTQAHKGEMAENQAASADVKDFAKTLVQDETQAWQHLSELAGKTGASIPRGINASKDQAIARLVSLKGDRFDRQFTRDEITAEQQAIAVFKREAARGHNADVKAYANSILTALQNDLRMAEKCAKTEKKS